MILLENLHVYQIAMEIGELVHELTIKWDVLNKKTLGDQFIRAADSIALNIAEGYGRYNYKENKNFCWFARGSLYETKSVNQKALNRKTAAMGGLDSRRTRARLFRRKRSCGRADAKRPRERDKSWRVRFPTRR